MQIDEGSMPQIVTFIITKHAQSAEKRLQEWNKTKFETMPQISTFSPQRCSKCLETLETVK